MAKRTLKQLHNDVYQARSVYEAAIKVRFKPDTPATVTHGQNRIPVRVVAVYGTAVRVRNGGTGKEYGVDATRLLEHDER